MVGRRRVLRAGAGALAVGLAGCPEGGPTATPAPRGTPDGPLSVASSAFEEGGTIPAEHTCEGADVSPPLRVGTVPGQAGSLAFVVDDPDAPGGTFVHWLLWNVPADRRELPAGVPRGETVPDLGGARQGENGFGVVGYRGPCPPPDDGPHTYRFAAYAVNGTLDLAPASTRAELDEALGNRVLATGQLTGEFDR